MSEPFFFSEMSFTEGVLRVPLHRLRGPWALVEFEVPRAFRFFNESDSFSYLETYDGPNLLDSNQGCSMNESTSSGYLTEYCTYTPEYRLESGLKSIVIISVQECVEVISVEGPSITLL